MIAEATFKNMTFDDGALSELQSIIEQIDQLQGFSHQVIIDFSDTTELLDELR